MKTQNDHPSNNKGAPAQNDRKNADQNRSALPGDKDAKHSAPTKLPGAGDGPKPEIEVRESGAKAQDSAKTVSPDTKTTPRADSERKST